MRQIKVNILYILGLYLLLILDSRYSVGPCQILQLQVVVPVLSLFLTAKPFLTELREKSSYSSLGFMENQDLYLPIFAKRKNTRKPVGIGPTDMTRSRDYFYYQRRMLK